MDDGLKRKYRTHDEMRTMINQLVGVAEYVRNLDKSMYSTTEAVKLAGYLAKADTLLNVWFRQEAAFLVKEARRESATPQRDSNV